MPYLNRTTNNEPFRVVGDIALFVAMAVVLIYGFTHFEIKPIDNYVRSFDLFVLFVFSRRVNAVCRHVSRRSNGKP